MSARLRLAGFLLLGGLAWGLPAFAWNGASPDPRVTRTPASSSPDYFYPIGDKSLFLASTPESGYELWVSDATVTGTRLLVDACPGPCSPQAIYPFATWGDRLFFGVLTATGRSELWVTAGAAESTRRIVEGPGPPGGGYSYPSWAVFGGRLIFSWRDSAGGNELWSSDGTIAGTGRLVDLRPGPIGSGSRELVRFGNRLAFTANDGVHGRSIFITDGTAAGTSRIAIPSAGAPAGRFPYVLSSLADRLVFLYTDGFRRQELWSLKRGATAAEKLFDLPPSFDEGHSFGWIVRGGELLFAGRPTGEEPGLWSTDGTKAGTRLLHAFGGNVRSLSLTPSGGALLGNLALFQLFRGGRSELGNEVRKIELWVSDGTSDGTRRLADLCRGPCIEDNSWIWPAREHAYVVLYDGARREIWATDGTVAGTAELASGVLDLIGPAGPDFYFSLFSRDASGGHPALDLWASDGTVEGTRQLTHAPHSPITDFFWPAAEAGGKLLLAGYDELHGVELWVSDGTPLGTRLLVDIAPGESEPE